MILCKQLNTLVTLEIVEFLVNIRYYLQYCHAPLFSLTTSSSIISHKTFSIIRGLHVQIQASIEPDYYNYIYMYMCVYVCIYVYVYMYVYIYIYIYIYICSIVSSSKLRKVLDQKQGAFTERMKLFCYGNGVVSFVIYIYIYICMYIYIYIYIYICVCVCICMYVCICIYVYIYTY